MKFLDRLLTIVITATLTSLAWIVAGGSLIQYASDGEGVDSVRPAEVAPSPAPSQDDQSLASDAAKPSLHPESASGPGESDARQLLIPVLNVRASDLTDTFTDSRANGSRLHEAIDIMAPEGTSVIAAGPGTVEKLFYSDAGGNTIYVRSPDKETIHYYAHMSEYAPGLTEGQSIRRGQRLGTVGSSGNASPEAPHLHFAIMRTTPDAAWWEPANAINPYPLLTRK